MRLEVPPHYFACRPVLALSLLLAVVFAGSACRKEGPQPQDLEPRENGVYAVLREGTTRAEARNGDDHCAVLAYENKYTGTGAGEPVRYIAIDSDSFVPMILEGAPDATKDDGGKTILSVTLKKEYVKPLEDFTRAQIGGKIAILIDGEIVTLHKVRSVITGGEFQVTRCTDNACEILRAKLTE